MTNIPAYLACMAGGAALACLWFCLDIRGRTGGKKAAGMSLTLLALGAVLGIICARLACILIHIDTLDLSRAGDLFTSIQISDFSYYGGMAGVALAVFLTAKIFGEPARDIKNAFAPMGAFMAAVARFAEGFMGFLGVGMYFEEAKPFPLAVGFTWDGEWYEYYLAVFVFEGIVSLIACLLSLLHRDEKDRFRRTVFYLCLPQIILESMRTQTISLLFLKAEQLACFLFCEGVLIRYAFILGAKKADSWKPALAGLRVLIVTALAEFLLDGKIGIALNMEVIDIPVWIIYSVVAVMLVLMAVSEHSGHKKIASIPGEKMV